jgi:hypothetical protein
MNPAKKKWPEKLSLSDRKSDQIEFFKTAESLIW